MADRKSVLDVQVWAGEAGCCTCGGELVPYGKIHLKMHKPAYVLHTDYLEDCIMFYSNPLKTGHTIADSRGKAFVVFDPEEYSLVPKTTKTPVKGS
jgi:hypothetical protein